MHNFVVFRYHEEFPSMVDIVGIYDDLFKLLYHFGDNDIYIAAMEVNHPWPHDDWKRMSTKAENSCITWWPQREKAHGIFKDILE